MSTPLVCLKKQLLGRRGIIFILVLFKLFDIKHKRLTSKYSVLIVIDLRLDSSRHTENTGANNNDRFLLL